LERHIGVAIFNPDILAFDVSKIAEALLECLEKSSCDGGGPRKSIMRKLDVCCAFPASGAARMLPPTMVMNARRSITV
jgi:hypothetical protein